MKDSTLVLVVVVILVLFLVGTILILGIFGRNSFSTTTGENVSPDLGMNCSLISCGEGTICDPLRLQCVYPDGHVCNNYADCASGSYCNGICVNGPNGEFGQYCPCSRGYTCVFEYNSICPGSGICGICKKDKFTSCQQSSECASKWCTGLSGQCKDGESGCYCSGGTTNGFRCNQNSDCASQYCDLTTGIGFCQNPGIVTGSYNASCAFVDNGAPCNDGLVCRNNICEVPQESLGLNCTNKGPCDSQTVCESLASSVSPVCVYPSLLSCATTNCIGGYSCGGDRMCRGNNQMAVTRLEQCLSGISKEMGINGIAAPGSTGISEPIIGNSHLAISPIVGLPFTWNPGQLLVFQNQIYWLTSSNLYFLDGKNWKNIRSDLRLADLNAGNISTMIFLSVQNEILEYDGRNFYPRFTVEVSGDITGISSTGTGYFLLNVGNQLYRNIVPYDEKVTVSFSPLPGITARTGRFYSSLQDDIVWTDQNGVISFLGVLASFKVPIPLNVISFDVYLATYPNTIEIWEIWMIGIDATSTSLYFSLPESNLARLGGSVGFGTQIRNRRIFNQYLCE